MESTSTGSEEISLVETLRKVISLKLESPHRTTLTTYNSLHLCWSGPTCLHHSGGLSITQGTYPNTSRASSPSTTSKSPDWSANYKTWTICSLRWRMKSGDFVAFLWDRVNLWCAIYRQRGSGSGFEAPVIPLTLVQQQVDVDEEDRLFFPGRNSKSRAMPNDRMFFNWNLFTLFKHLPTPQVASLCHKTRQRTATLPPQPIFLLNAVIVHLSFRRDKGKHEDPPVQGVFFMLDMGVFPFIHKGQTILTICMFRRDLGDPDRIDSFFMHEEVAFVSMWQELTVFTIQPIYIMNWFSLLIILQSRSGMVWTTWGEFWLS